MFVRYDFFIFQVLFNEILPKLALITIQVKVAI